LRQALIDAASNDTITFDPSLSGATIRLLSTLTISKNVTIDGSSLVSQVIISGDANNSGTNNAGDVRVMIVNSGITLNLNNVTVERGYANTSVAPGATEGGGIYTNAGTINITNSTLRSNYSPVDGGAIFVYNGNLTVKNSTFSGNTSNGWGGALYAMGGSYTVSNSTFSGNTTVAGGTSAGAILGRVGGIATTMNIYNSTFSGNSSVTGGVIRNQDTATITFYNTIIANNSANCTGTITNGSNNIDDGTTCGFGSTSGSKSSTNPLLNALSANGGPTQTMSLQSGSPALGAGSASVCSASPVNNLDQSGQSRPQGNAVCDIGAYESNLVLDTTAPTVTAFTATSPSTSLNIPITSFTASDDIAVTGYMITASSSQPSAGAAGWTGTAPTTYTVGSEGTYTLYPWVKDTAGNVSSVYGSPVSVTVTGDNALDLDGSNDYVRIANPYTGFTNQITVEAWVYFDGGSDGIWMGQSAADVDAMSTNVWLWHSNGTNSLTWYVNNGGSWLNLNMVSPSNGWHHIATVASNTGMRIYVDGVLNAQNASSLTSLQNVPTAALDIGKDPRFATPSGRVASERVDELRVWNVARTQAQISA